MVKGESLNRRVGDIDTIDMKSFQCGVVCAPLVTEKLLTTLGTRLPTLCTELMESHVFGLLSNMTRTSSQILRRKILNICCATSSGIHGGS
jgi:hypothetical protein